MEKLNNPAHKVMRSLQRTSGNRPVIFLDILVAICLLGHALLTLVFAYVPVVGNVVDFFQPRWLRILTTITDLLGSATLLAMALWRSFGRPSDWLWLWALPLLLCVLSSVLGVVFAPNLLTIGFTGLQILLLILLYIAFVWQHRYRGLRLLAPYNHDF
jgi:hypothetical protein